MQAMAHIDFILAAYAAGIIVIAALIAWVMLDYRAQSAKLAELENRGITRGAAGRAAAMKEVEEDV